MRAKITNRMEAQAAGNGARAVFFPQSVILVPSSSKGFTLVEMVIVMVITGIIGGMVAMFLRAPVQQYMDVARRAELTDIADTAFHRLLRDIRTAVPNSVRLPVASGSTYIEFVPTKSGGRYRANDTGGVLCAAAAGNTKGDALSFIAADSCFQIIGPALNFAAGDWIVVGSTQSDGSLPYDNTATGVLRSYTGAAGAQAIVQLTPIQFPASAELSSQRFQVVDGAQEAVMYACVGTQLIRYWGYGFLAGTAPPVPPITTRQGLPAATPGNAVPPATPGNAVLADNISGCSFVYDIVNQRNGLVAITLQISKDGETVSLYEEVHVNNVP